MTPNNYTRIVLQERPVGDIEPNTFRTEVVPFDLKAKDGEVLIQVNWLSLDPAMRGWLRDTRSYVPPVQIGEIMRAMGLGTVIEVGKGSRFKVGDIVRGRFGWTEYIVSPDQQLEPIVISEGVHELDYLNTLGIPGLSAYFGLRDIGKLKEGEILVVSGAAGAVGSLACQIGKRSGAKVYAIAGSPEKCAWLENEIGVDKALNYKDPSFKQQFRAIPYADVYFDNVGGEMLDMVLAHLKKGARIVLCGAISDYNKQKPTGLQNYTTLITQRAKIEGFVALDYQSEYPAAMKTIEEWLMDGSIKRKFHIVEGLTSAPSALMMLFTGKNTGKLVVKVTAKHACHL